MLKQEVPPPYIVPQATAYLSSAKRLTRRFLAASAAKGKKAEGGGSLKVSHAEIAHRYNCGDSTVSTRGPGEEAAGRGRQ